MDKIIRRKSVDQLKCFLNEREQRDKGKELAEAFSRKAQHERELESLKKQFGGKIKVEEANIERLQEVIISGYEYRYIEVETEYNYIEGIVERVRLDTSEIFDTRPMTSDERQAKIVFNPEEPSEGEDDQYIAETEEEETESEDFAVDPAELELGDKA